jgi:LuxR family maltose regulon positive regulatory protein
MSLDYLNLDSQVTYARLLVAQDRCKDARKLLKRLETFLDKRGLNRRLIAVYVLRAAVEERADERETACEYLSKAILLAVPNDYYRVFLDTDPVVITLLPKVRPVAPGFVDQLMDYAGLPRRWTEAQSQPLIEPLSARELDVLSLIVAGYKNQEIADRLVIAKGTVKRHINNIYGKLDVHSRTEAVARTWALHLLNRES